MKRLYCESGVRRPSAAGEAEAIAGAKQYPEKLEAIRHGCQKLNRSQVPVLFYPIHAKGEITSTPPFGPEGVGSRGAARSATSENRGEW